MHAPQREHFFRTAYVSGQPVSRYEQSVKSFLTSHFSSSTALNKREFLLRPKPKIERSDNNRGVLIRSVGCIKKPNEHELESPHKQHLFRKIVS